MHLNLNSVHIEKHGMLPSSSDSTLIFLFVSRALIYSNNLREILLVNIHIFSNNFFTRDSRNDNSKSVKTVKKKKTGNRWRD